METPAPSRSRKGLYIPVALFALACLAWTGFWFYARSRAVEVMDAWMTREARLGRTWTCPSRDIGGYPFRFEISCANPTYTSAEPSRAGTGSLAGLTVTARVVDPRQVIAVFTSPLKWTAAAGDSVEMTFANARASYRGSAGAIDDTALELDQPALKYSVPGLEPQSIAAAKTLLNLRRAPGEEAATDLAVTASGVQSDLVNALLSDPAPGKIEFSARLTKLLPAPPRDWRETLDLWRLAKGEAQVQKLLLAKGPIMLDVTGQLRLDEARRLEGEIGGTAAGVNTLLQAFGINIGGGGGGGLLGALLSGGKPKAQAQNQALPFTLRFEQGRLFIGPIPGPRLRPLF